MYHQSRPPFADFPFWHQRHVARVTCRETARVFPSFALGGGTFLGFSSASLSFSLDVHPFISRAALRLFLFSSTPDATNCALLDEILLSLRSSSPRCCNLRLLSSPIRLPRKRRDRATRSLYSPEREETRILYIRWLLLLLRRNRVDDCSPLDGQKYRVKSREDCIWENMQKLEMHSEGSILLIT